MSRDNVFVQGMPVGAQLKIRYQWRREALSICPTTSCMSVCQHVCCYVSDMFRLMIKTIFRETVDTEEHLMIKRIIVGCTW